MSPLAKISRFARRYFCRKSLARDRRWLKRMGARWRRRRNRQELDADYTRRGWRGLL